MGPQAPDDSSEGAEATAQLATLRKKLREQAERIAQLETALERRTVIAQATGYLMCQYRIDEARAFAVLRRRARNDRQDITGLAQTILAGEAMS